MTATTEQLKQAGFKYDFDRDIYFHREKKIVVSLEYIEDHNNIDEIINSSKSDTWRFYFNILPSENVKESIIKQLEK